MPNWVEGSLKLRGKYDDIMRFFEDGINVYQHKWDFEKNESIESILDKSVWLRMDESVISGRQHPSFPDGLRECEIYLSSDEPYVYVEGTNRAFLDGDQYIYVSERKDSDTVAPMRIRQAWDFRDENWVEIAKKYNCDVRLWGSECGMCFERIVDISRDGTINMSVTNKYSDWEWEAVFPWMGG